MQGEQGYAICPCRLLPAAFRRGRDPLQRRRTASRLAQTNDPGGGKSTRGALVVAGATRCSVAAPAEWRVVVVLEPAWFRQRGARVAPYRVAAARRRGTDSRSCQSALRCRVFDRVPEQPQARGLGQP